MQTNSSRAASLPARVTLPRNLAVRSRVVTSAIVVFAVFWFDTPAQAQSRNSSEATNFAAGTNPGSVAIGDFDGDLAQASAILTALIEQRLRDTGVPSISIALVRDDEIIWTAAFGYSNVRTRTPASPDTLYNAASTFKAVTATAVMQLVEQGKLELDAPANQYLGDHPVRDRIQSEKPVTVAHLLSHWSGLTSWPGRGEASMKPIWSREVPYTLERVASELYSIRPPEAKFEYNNYAYGVAGLLIERVSGLEYERYVVDHILAPLGIETPHPVFPNAEMVEMMALPYEVRGESGPPKPAPQVLTDVYPAGGTAYLTAADMARFLGAHLNGGVFQETRILSRESVQAMHVPRSGGNYGFGFRVRKTARGTTMIRHTGRMPGMSSMMLGDVDDRVGVYYMTNALDDRFGDIAEVALSLLRGEPYPPPERRAIRVDPAILERYVGTYELDGAIFSVTLEGGSLWLQKNRKKGELLAETPEMFFLRGDPATVSFEMTPSGRADRMLITPADWIISVARRQDTNKELE